MLTRACVLVDGWMCAIGIWHRSTTPRSSIIEQDIFLFSRSIADSIQPVGCKEEVETVARKVQAHDFIADFPEGYDTVVGQRWCDLEVVVNGSALPLPRLHYGPSNLDLG